MCLIYFKDNEYYIKDNKKSLDTLYISNNICESINAKINFYLPKKITSNFNFVNVLTKIFINSKFENKNIRRHDYVTKAIIKLIIDEKLNDNPRWVQFEEIKNKQKYIITGYESEMEENEIDKLIDTLNNMDINENENKLDENLSLKVNNSESEEISESENLEEEDEKEKYENNKSNMDIENNNNNNNLEN